MDPDLQIRQGRGVGVEVRGSHPGTEISRGGGGVSKKIFFLGPWASVWFKNKRGVAGSPRPLPWTSHC